MTEATGTDWPATRWGLTAPESYVVLNGPSADGNEAFKLGLTELVARGSLVLETIEQRGRFRTKSVAMLRDGPRSGPTPDQPLAAIWDLYSRAPHRVTDDGLSRVAVEDLARAAARQYQSLDRYVRREVLPPLVERGLYAARSERVLWIFPTTRYVLTPEGESARTELQRWMDVGAQRFAGWAADEPSNAMAYAAMAGASLLLMPALLPEMRHLRRPADYGGMDGADGTDVSTGWIAPAGVELPSIDLSHFDFGNFDFSAFDALDSAMSAIDAAVDSGGGGDSGGGFSDGGSSGSDGGGGGGGES